MADAIGNKAAKDYHLDIPAPEQGFFAKGLGHGDWGAKNRLSRLFNPKSGNTVMLAFDHGYIMGSTAGLERMDVTIAPLCQYADVLMGARGVDMGRNIFQSEHPAAMCQAVAKIVHEKFTDKEAYQFYQELASK